MELNIRTGVSDKASQDTWTTATTVAPDPLTKTMSMNVKDTDSERALLNDGMEDCGAESPGSFTDEKTMYIVPAVLTVQEAQDIST